MQAIVTKYFGPTNNRGARIKASAWAGSIWVPWDHALDVDENHDAAARALAEKREWTGQWIRGGMPDTRGNVYVNIGKRRINHAFAVKGKPNAG